MNVIVLVIGGGFSQTMNVKHPQEEVNYPEWGIYQSKCTYIREAINIDLG